MKLLYARLFTIVSLSLNALNAIPYITLSLQLPPLELCSEVLEEKEREAAVDKLAAFLARKPHYLAKHHLNAQVYDQLGLTVSGFLVFYNGFLDYTKRDGIVEFPLTGHDASLLRVVVCSSLEPIVQSPNYIERWQIPASKADKAQSFIYRKKTLEGGVPAWEVTRETVQSDQRDITPQTLVILTDPTNIMGMTGVYPTSDIGQIALPESLYVMGTVQQTSDLLRSLDIQRFFEQMKYTTTTTPEGVLQIVPETK